MATNAIIEHFIKDLEYHQKLLEKFAKSIIAKSPEANEDYNTLRNSIRRHSNQEEVMYSKYEPKDKKLYEILEKAREQYRELIRILDACYQAEYDDNCEGELNKFKKKFIKQIKIKKQVLYPYFDKEMAKKGYTEIIDDIDMYDPIDN